MNERASPTGDAAAPMPFVGPRLFILGAGFSKPAGLPLASELLDLVLAAVAREIGSSNQLSRSVSVYERYVVETTGASEQPVDLERFAAFLDYQHALGMLGNDTWSEDGNRDQCLLRWGIGRVLRDATPKVLPPAYLEFARRLRPSDTVLTFNYDLVLERALDEVGKPYRRFPGRFRTSGNSDRNADLDEVVVLKPHGSIDWIDRTSFDHEIAFLERTYKPEVAAHARRFDTVFGEARTVSTQPLTEGPRPVEDPLVRVEVLSSTPEFDSIGAYYATPVPAITRPPLILAPSSAKLIYGRAMHGFWRELSGSGWALSGLVIIGYSLPDADPYSRQILWRVEGAYRRAIRDPGWRVSPMSRIQVVDLQRTHEAQSAFRRRWRFLDQEHTDFTLTGFDIPAVAAVCDAPALI